MMPDNPFLGEIQLVAFNFAPQGWAFCNGQLLSISQNTALFSLLGTTYGGDGVTTFALPNLQGRVPLHFGAGQGLSPRNLGQLGGEEAVTLTAAQMPAHSHSANCHPAAGDGNTPVNKYWSKDLGTQSGTYHSTGGAAMNPGALSNAGEGRPHDNMPPFLGLNFIIALQGIFPSRS